MRGSTKTFLGLEGRRQEILDRYFEGPIERARKEKLQLPPGLFVIGLGKIELSVPISRNRVAVVGELGEDDFFGEIAHLRAPGREKIRAAEAEIIEAPLVVYRLRERLSDSPQDTLEALFQNYPRVAVNMLSEMARRLASQNRYVYYSSFDRTRLELARLSEGKESISVSVSSIARSIGYTWGGVKTSLKQLASGKVIKLKPKQDGYKITILDRKRLTDGLFLVT